MGHAFSLSGPENMYALCNSFLNCRRADLHSFKLATNRETVFKSEQSLFFLVAKYCPMAKKLKICYKVEVYVKLDRYIRSKLNYFYTFSSRIADSLCSIYDACWYSSNCRRSCKIIQNGSFSSYIIKML